MKIRKAGFIVLSSIAILIVVIVGFRRKNYIRVEADRLLAEIDESKKYRKKLLAEAAAKHQYANELLYQINISLSKVECLKNPPKNSGN